MAAYNPARDIDAIKAAADTADAGTKYLIMTTITRYQTQLKLLQDLQEDMRLRGTMLHLPGEDGPTPNPSASEYSRIASAANSTARTLLGLVQSIERPLSVVPDDEL